ncbi:TM2 domain-containing protein [Apibacter mensalis]|uniref:TM2 domain-containing protein n=1 Tax=Apibacter mensalis TaxID=1586267 RepID=A0A0X3ASI1_9FLAO|nr:TM2 domain-containing protein [Apibacter mensalis]CVK16828.1 TM2 domain-containing protein [Apibacter mensalis]
MNQINNNVSEISKDQIKIANDKKLISGICGILLGSFGIHKLYLGYTKEGLIMLLVSLLTCGAGAFFMSIIGIIEGVTYLTKSDEDFYKTYIVGHKGWF